ncbi:MAG: MarR family transcriptional regulator, partial [Inquilinus sp.]|nr:MarR family transcriptional regulator [Inquilinus sp.]
VIDRLESRDLVVRGPSPSDRRSYALRLSDAGKRLMQELMPKIRAHEEAISESLTDSEKSLLVSLLKRIGS